MDPYLYELMHGSRKISSQPSISKLERNLNAEIDQLVEKMVNDSQLEKFKLLDEQQKRTKIRFEIQEALKMDALKQTLGVAMQILISESGNQKLLEELISLSETNSEKIKIALSDPALDSILEIALVKFSQDQFADCLALLTLLTIISPEIANYWLRLGISAQKLGQYDLALRAYEASDELDPKLIEAKLLAIECCIQLNIHQEAKSKLDQAKKFAAQHKVDSMWLDLISILQEKLKPN